MADNKMEKSIKEAIGKSLNEFNKRIGMAKLIKDNKNQDRILKGILSQVNDENIEKTEKSNVITLDNSTDGIVELQEIKGDTNVNVSKMEKETPITHVIDDKNGNVISLDGITEGAINIDDIQGNTMVNCNKDTYKELILMPNLDTNGYSNITLTQGIDGGKVDVSLEGNTMVNVCDQEEPVAITKSYTVETGNHVALQGEYDGKCRPNIYGNTLVNLGGNSNLWDVGCSGEINTDYTITSTNAQGIVVDKLTDNVSYLYFRKRIDSSLFKPSTTYTIIFNSLKANNVGVVSGNTAEIILPLTPCNDGYNAISITSTDFSTITGKNVIYLYLAVNKQFIGTVKVSDFIVLEGDYTNKPIPDYFTGMKSSFEDKLVPENLASDVVKNGKINKQYTDLSTVSSSKLKRNTKYTTFIKNDGDEDIQVYSNDTSGNFIFTKFTIPAKSSKVVTISTKDTELDSTKKIWLSLFVTETLPQNVSAYLVEGDYTNYDFTDYDLTKAGKYKVDYKVTGKNKCPRCTTTSASHNGITLTYDATTQTFSYSGTATNTSSYLNLKCPNFKLLKDKSYLFSVDNSLNDFYLQITEFNVGYNCNLRPNTTVTPIYNLDKYIPNAIMLYSQNLTIGQRYSGTFKVMIEEGTTATTYEPYKEYTKTLYLNSPLLEGDTIEQSGNNIIHNHRYGKVVLDGSDDESWILHDNQPSDTSLIRFLIEMSSKKAGSFNIICDKMSIGSLDGNFENINTECISGHPVGVAINIWVKKGKLSTQDVAGFKKYLQQNPITVVYELAQPTQEIISTDDNLLLDSYTNGHLDVDTVVPIDKVEFRSADQLAFTCKYLCDNTSYIVQFESDSTGIINFLALGKNDSGALLNQNVVKGLNKLTLSTGNNNSNYFYIDGIGFNASKIVVTPKVDNNFGYFKGMKSVGECEGNKIEILSQNKNLWNPTIDNTIINSKHDATYSNGILTIKGKGDGTSECYTNYRNPNPFISQQLKPNTSYYFSYESDGEFGGVNGTDTIEALIFGGYGNGIKFYISPKGTTFKTDDKGFTIFRFDVNKNDMTHTFYNFMLTEGTAPITFTPHKHNKKEILLNEPLRGLPNGVRDKYTMIDGKWYIERNCGKVNMYELEFSGDTNDTMKVLLFNNSKPIAISNIFSNHNDFDTLTKGQMFVQERGGGLTYVWIPTDTMSNEEFKRFLNEQNATIIFAKSEPTYEPIDYNPLEVYTETTHISNNSNIPANMVIKNTGYNCILKPNTTYTISSSNGLSTVTTKDNIGDSVLRFYNKDTSSITKMNNVLVLEGDYVTGNPPIPAFFKGMESAFEQELVTDETSEHYGKYKVEVSANNGNLFDMSTYESGLANIEFKNNGFRLYTTKPMTYANAIFRAKVKPFTDYRVYADIKITKGSALGDAYDTSDHWFANTLDTFNSKNNTELTIRFYCTANVSMIGDVEYTNIRLIEVGHNTNFVENKHNKIQFFLNEPLRGVNNIKDKVYVKEDKVVVQRNCGVYTYKGLEQWTIEGYGIKNFTKFVGYNFPNAGGEQCVSNLASYNIDKAGISIRISPTLNRVVFINNYFEYISNVENRLQAFKKYLSNNNLNIVYQLATPTYEEVEYSNNRLTLNTYNNSTLFYNSNIPVSNTSFKPLWEELIYIKNSTTYYIQFNAVGNGNVVVNLGGTELTTTITEGYNKIEITTPNNSTNLLTIDGQGIKISKVVVSEALCSGYYKGLQSCFEEHMENGKYVCVIRGISLDGNKVNGIKFYLNEPLRGIGDIKDRLCIKDGKLMVERKFSSAIFDGSEDENWLPTGYGGHATRNTFEINLINLNTRKGVVPSISNLFINEQVADIPINDNAYRVYTNAQNITYFLFTPSTDIIPYRDIDKWKKYLQQNPVKIVYQLATTVYEEVTNEYGLPIILEGYENGIVYVDSSVTPTTSIKYTSNNKVPATLTNVDNLNTTTQNDINNNIVTYMMDIDMMLTEMEVDDNASVMSLSDSDDNNQNHDSSHSNILDRMNKEDRIKYQDNTTKMLEKVIKGKSLTKEENINRIDLYLSEGKIRKEQSNYLKELLKGVE